MSGAARRSVERTAISVALRSSKLTSLVDVQPLALREHGGVGRIIVAAKHVPGRDDLHRRRPGKHGAHLHRRGVRAQDAPTLDEKGVLHVARGVIGRSIERVEVVPLGLDQRSRAHLETRARGRSAQSPCARRSAGEACPSGGHGQAASRRRCEPESTRQCRLASAASRARLRRFSMAALRACSPPLRPTDDQSAGMRPSYFISSVDPALLAEIARLRER